MFFTFLLSVFNDVPHYLFKTIQPIAEFQICEIYYSSLSSSLRMIETPKLEVEDISD